ncbi:MULTISPECIES: LacI family DNA-binding transcriptional regulator [Thermogemmatispora]|uniref:LacI family DNA-binding transcriptional regulator n=1 Tax=Thermogemmatispora TaxID=768669 RepID=UPI00069B18DD|nr:MULTISPECIES: LacI family DNA-binding transcriptional regulator [Thermogemmatispora]
MDEKLTIQDIARLAGVSKSSVSRVLNNYPAISQELRERVMRVVREYNFVPNVTARGLAGGKTRLVGVLTPPLTWPAIPEILRGVAEYIERTSYEMVLYSINFENPTHTDVVDRILSLRMVSGLLAILPCDLTPHLLRHFERGLPMVMINDQEPPEHFPCPWVGVDNRTGGYQATRHLLDLGYRRIAHVMGPKRYYCAQERYEGYCQALHEAGLAPDPELLLQGEFDPASGRRCARELFARERTRWPEAIFVANDQMAYGFLEVAEEQGIQIPQDVALVGFDDNLVSSHVRPPLTTVRQPFSQMGAKAIELLLMMVDPDHVLPRTRASQDGKHSQAGAGMTPAGGPLATAAAGSDHQLGARAGAVLEASAPYRLDGAIHIQLDTSLVVRASSVPA